ncbi:hypothetical protein KXV85_006235, partial [Aspergillus fumigatus]
CSTPIRAGSSGCASQRARNGRRRAPSARAGVAKSRRTVRHPRAKHPHRRRATRPDRSESVPASASRRPRHHPDLGMETRHPCDGRRRVVGARAGAIQHLSGAVRHPAGPGLADRRDRRRTARRRSGRGADRLLVRARLFRARPLLDRLRLLRRCR